MFKIYKEYLKYKLKCILLEREGKLLKDIQRVSQELHLWVSFLPTSATETKKREEKVKYYHMECTNMRSAEKEISDLIKIVQGL